MTLRNIFSVSEYEELKKSAMPVRYPHVAMESLKNHGLVLFGLGRHGRALLDILPQADLTPEWLVDNNFALHGTRIAGLEVRGVESLSQAGRRYVLLAGQFAPDMAADCRKFNADNWILPAALADFLYTTGELGISLAELDALPEVEECYNLLADEESRLVFKDFIRFQTCFDQRLFRHYDAHIYFPEGLKDRIDYSCFVDAGAFNGDTLKLWLNHVPAGVYHGFEPQQPFFKELEAFASGLPRKSGIQLHLYNKALGSRAASSPLFLSGILATLSLGLNPKSSIGPIVPVMRMDDLTPFPPTVIKADVEGYEMEVLKGAGGCVSEKTSFIFSLYHRKRDFFTIPLYIKSIQPRTRIYIRQHGKVYEDTVCYAIAN